MRTNILVAVKNILENPLATINPAEISNNRVNNVGDALESFVKDAFVGLVGVDCTGSERTRRYSESFSWLGNPNNPPDSMLRGGDGLEVKKVDGLRSAVPLNSSYPKQRLYSNDSRIANGARNCEEWSMKDLVYFIGSTNDSNLKRLWIIYGDCYAANKNVYDRLALNIEAGINATPDIEFEETNELGKVKKVDPLGITDLRIRGMWHIDNPSRLYEDLVSVSGQRQYYVLMKETKYQSFPEEDKQHLEQLSMEGYSNEIIDIRDPDNPANLIKGRFIKYEV